MVVNGGTLADLSKVLRCLPAPMASFLLMWMGNEFDAAGCLSEELLAVCEQEMSRLSEHSTMVALGAADTWKYSNSQAASFESYRQRVFPMVEAFHLIRN